MATGPRALLEQIVSTGYPWIQQAIGRELESVFLEFKEKESPDREDLQTSDKKNYAKELSAFANASGGVIVWGIGKDKAPSDLAGEEKPIKFLKSFCAKLNNLSATALDPPLAGIENHPIPIPGNENEGFVVTYVPGSEGGPHRALCGQNQYFIRTGTTSPDMGHALLGIYFGRKRRPDLRLNVWINPVPADRRTFEPSVLISLANVGKYLALYPAVTIDPTAPWSVDQFGIDGNYNFNLSRVPEGNAERRKTFVGGANSVIHPTARLDVCRLHQGLTIELPRVRPTPSQEDFLRFDYAIYAQDCEPVHGTFSLDSDSYFDLLDATPPGRPIEVVPTLKNLD